jgi:S1-C subfamily serine protease
MDPVTAPSRRPLAANLLSGALGGLIVLAVGGALLATDVIDTGDQKTVVRETALPQPGSDRGEGRSVRDIYRREGRGVVFIQARGVSGESPFGFPEPRGTATGSGFVVSRDGIIVTNAHVVEGSNDVTVGFGDQGQTVDAEVKGSDPSTDVAVLKVDPDKAKLDPMPLGDSSKAEVGDPVVAIGNPFGFTRTVTTGIVSAKQRRITAPNGFQIPNVIQTDASINPGNSGGPLLDGNGRVIGINSQIATGGGRGSVGIAFAIPINTAKSLLPRLKKGAKIERAYLGVNMVDVTDQLARDLNLPVKRGALIQNVVEGGPADRAGLHGGRTPVGGDIVAGGDAIVGVDGERVRSGDDVAAAIGEHEPGDKVEIVYYRGKDKKTAKVELGKRPNRLQTEAVPESPDDNNLLPLP